MIYPSDVEQKLGFDQIRLRLINYCLCPLGQKLVGLMKFSPDFEQVRTRLNQNLEFKQILDKGEAFPVANFFDPELLFQTIAVEESYVEEVDLLKIALSLQVIVDCQSFLSKTKDVYPELWKLGERVNVPVKIVSTLLSKLDERGRIKDNASVELARIRKRLREEEGRARKITEQIFRQAVSQGWVPDGVSPAIREGRVVIPILSEHKRKLKGFILDESATGQTIYLEPAEVLEANNEIRDLEHADRREVIKILKELTALLRFHLQELRQAYQFLAWIDFSRAKAKLSQDLNADLPKLTDSPDLNWMHARHPLLYLTLKGKRSIVPLSIDLTSKDRMLLVSGPNAGGKSVCLKTVGLIQYMAQCGLLVPLHDKSTLGIFQDIFLDIGDQQSIENDLSTYSSHLRNMSYFIQHASAATLVLMDELGAGTDPNFGGGIAQAVLATLLDKKVWGVATTHYYNLKLFAENNEGIRNGAMLFDSRNLEPLFKLEIGKPGSSFALEIARKTGLPKQTILSAELIIGKDLTGLESLMKTVADEKQAVAKKEMEVKLKEKNLAETLAKYEKLSSELEFRKKEIINKAKDEASYLLKETNREIEKTIRHIRENKAEKKETRKIRQNLEALSEKLTPAQSKPSSIGKEKIKEGDSVRLIGQEVSGTVISIKGNSALVQFGDLRSTVKINQLIRSDRIEASPTFSKARALGLDMHHKQSRFVSTLDIRGKRVEEVSTLIDQFLDDAILLSQHEVKILHGTGEGVLRKVIREKLKSLKAVASFADEHVERGGAGITVVILK